MPQTKKLIDNMHLLLTVVEAGKSKVKAAANLLPDAGSCLLSCCVLTWLWGYGAL
jgi:hypothetical protein